MRNLRVVLGAVVGTMAFSSGVWAAPPAENPPTAAEKFPEIPAEAAPAKEYPAREDGKVPPSEPVETPVGAAPSAPVKSETIVAPENSSVASAGPEAPPALDAFWVFFGANAGYSTVSPGSGVRESKRSGPALHVKALLSKYWTDWVADLGVGYQHHKASGRDRFSPLVDPDVKVTTRSAFVEFSPRYRLDAHWQLGPVLNGFFGTDVAFDESTTQANQNFALAGGLRADYETSFGSADPRANRWRFGAQALRDLTVADRGIWWFMADVQFGFALGDGRPAAAPLAASAGVLEIPPPARPVAPRFAEVTPEKAVKVYLGEAVLRFQTASAELRPSSRQILEKVAKYLNRSPDAWKTMRVDGHADKRGKLEYNMRLSKARADRVKGQLVRLKVPKGKITTEGFGPTRPIDAAEDLEAYALNRRVELWIDGVSDPDTLVRDLNELK